MGPGSWHRWTPERIAAFERAWRDGMPLGRLAQRLGLPSASAVRRVATYLRARGISIPPRSGA